MTTALTARAFDQGLRGRILIVITLSWFFVLGVRLSFPVLLPYINAEFGLNLIVAGMLMSTLFAGYAVGQISGASSSTGSASGTSSSPACRCSCSASASSASCGASGGFVGGIFLLSVASAIFAPARFIILSGVYFDREGTSHGVAMAAGDIGNTLLPVVAGMISVTFIWRLGVGYALPFLFVLVLALARIVPERTSAWSTERAVSFKVLGTLHRELARKPILIAVFLLFAQ